MASLPTRALLLALATATAAYVGDGASSRSGALVGARRRRCVVSLAAARPKAVVFDLDGCLWYPDMYMLWGGGAPFKVASDGALIDTIGQRVTMIGAVPQIFLELKTHTEWASAAVCVASCTDEPNWAQECMTKFMVDGGEYSIKDVVQVEEIHKGNKRSHLKSIAERTGIALDEMLFLDNEWGNCQDVSSIGVTVAYTPDGVTREAWDKALAGYPAPGEVIYG